MKEVVKKSLYCPKCGQEYHCPCRACKGNGWKFVGKNDEQCLRCGLRMSCDWWFDLECDIFREEMKSHK